MITDVHGVDVRPPQSDGLLQLILFVRRNASLLAIACISGGLCGVLISMLVQPIYRSEVVSVTVSDETRPAGVGDMGGEIGGLAALAGVSLGSGHGNQDEILAFLRSRELGQAFIARAHVEQALTHRGWRRFWAKLGLSEDTEDGPARAYRVFDREVRTIQNDKKAGVVRVSIDWVDPQGSADLANAFVALANERLRAQYEAEGKRKLDFLTAALHETQEVEVRTAIGRVIESTLRMQTLAASRVDFALKVIDPARPSLRVDRLEPRRGLYLLAGALVGFGLASLAAVRRRILVD
jgi:uncharacterized protein involved in exopolysaccharide biosynthesis